MFKVWLHKPATIIINSRVKSKTLTTSLDKYITQYKFSHFDELIQKWKKEMVKCGIPWTELCNENEFDALMERFAHPAYKLSFYERNQPFVLLKTDKCSGRLFFFSCQNKKPENYHNFFNTVLAEYGYTPSPKNDSAVPRYQLISFHYSKNNLKLLS